MSKLDEKQIEKTHKSAAGQEDKAFEEWISQRVLDETAEMINGLENDPDLDDFEPSEELFQKIVGVAKERGLLAEADETAEDATTVNLPYENKTMVGEKETQEIFEYTQMPRKKKAFRFYHRRSALKWTAMVAITLLGVFGVSMSSQANRTYVMQKMDEALGNNKNTIIENDSDRVESLSNEEKDKENIEQVLGIKLPSFYYIPSGMEYLSYSLDEGAQTAYIEYSYNTELVHFIIIANCKDASAMSRNDSGKKIKTITNELSNIDIELWEVKENDDRKSTFIGEWNYKNSYFEIIGKLEKEDIISMLEKMVY